jgi:hypothetical protein
MTVEVIAHNRTRRLTTRAEKLTTQLQERNAQLQLLSSQLTGGPEWQTKNGLWRGSAITENENQQKLK